MEKAKSDVEYMYDEIKKRLVGGKIVTAYVDEEGVYFGFKVRVGGRVLNVWVNQDAEANGPGWLNIEEGGS